MKKKFSRKRTKRTSGQRSHKNEVHKQLKKGTKKNKRKREKTRMPDEIPVEEVLQDVSEDQIMKEEPIETPVKKFKQNLNRMKLGLLPLSAQSLLEAAQNNGSIFELKEHFDISEIACNTGASESSLRAFYREVRKLIEMSDVVIEVIDARDPLGTRCRQLEMEVLNSGSKRLVLLLNKADLVPPEILEKWLKYLRTELPAVAFKASTQGQKRRLGQSHADVNQAAKYNTSNCLGAKTLLALLGNYCRNKGIKTSINVGIIGLPNVGKSSVINSLCRKRSCQVGAAPGVTKTMNSVKLDSKVRLIDSPGVVFSSGGQNDAHAALRNAVRFDQLEDPMLPVGAILQRVCKEELMSLYGIESFSTLQEFLCHVARKQGKLKKKGYPDIVAAARTLLQDWNCGKIKYYTVPPDEVCASEISSSLVTEMAKEFDLASLEFMEIEQNELSNLQPDMSSAPSILVNMNREILPATIHVEVKEKKSRKRKSQMSGTERKAKYLEEEILGNQSINKNMKRQIKSLRKVMKKQRKRNEKDMSSLANMMGASLDLEENSDNDDVRLDSD